MSGFNKARLENLLIYAKDTLFPDDTVTLTIADRVVRASTVSANGAFTITLPSVKEAAGLIFTIYMVARNSTDDITIADNNDDSGLSDITLNLAADQVVLYSDGYLWHTLISAGV